MEIVQKILVILLIAILLLNMGINNIYAAIEVNLEKAYIEKIGEADYHLKYYREDREMYTYVTCDIVGYYENGNFNPAYCMNRDLSGAGKGSYYVTTEKILDNDAVWRVIKNGYPYKNAKSLGLTSDYDAFVVTKMAVYCILGESKLKYFKAEDNDKEAVAMLEALKKLVDIGKNGTEKQDDNPLTSQKVGDLIEEKEYYSQEYQVKSTAEFGSYQVKALKMSEGAYIANTNGEKQTKFKAGENFKIIVPKENMNKDIDVDLEISAECKAYIILEGKTTITKTQNYVVTTGEYSKATTKINLKLKTNTGKIIINKNDSETKKGIEGVEFELVNNTGKKIAIGTTNSDGILEFSGLYQGSYILHEIKANENYTITQLESNIDIKYNEEKTTEIVNEYKKGNLKILKVDKDNKNVPIEGVEFDLYSKEQGKVVGTYTTDENGEIYIENLRIGEYKIIEKSVNKWYNLSNEENIEIKWNETTESVIENELKKSQIKITKVDKDNNEIKIEGAKFEVLDKDRNVLETITTDSNGEAKTKKYPVRDYEKIYLKEIETNDKYVLDDKLIVIKLETGKDTEITIENEKIKGQIKIIKTASQKSNITGLEAGAPLEGVVFKIYDENNNLVQELTTDKNGIAITEKLEKGKYKIKEVSTNKWYYLNDEVVECEITDNNQIVEVELKNEPKNPAVNVEKSGQEKAQPGEEIQYDISTQNTGNTALNEFTLIDTIPTDFIQVTKFKTGTYNQRLNYNLYYKTNLSNDEYILLMEDLDTFEDYEIDFSQELADNEFLTEIKLDFGTIDIGFCSNENPHIFAIVKSELKNGTSFTNIAKVSGKCDSHKVSDNSKWKTLIYKLLPRTGF